MKRESHITQRMRKMGTHILAFGLATLIVFVFGGAMLNWVVMPWVTRRGQEIEVPDVTEMKVMEAEKALGKADLRLVLDGTQNDPDVPPGHIVSQTPEAYSLVKKGRRIYATVSKGGALYEMIAVSGGSVRQARLKLRQHGFEVEEVREEPSYTVPKGVVIAQDPKPGEMVERGTLVMLTVSAGKGGLKILMPDLVGKGFEETRAIIEEMGLRLEAVEQQTSVEVIPNTVLEQHPEAGEEIRERQKVRLVVSKL